MKYIAAWILGVPGFLIVIWFLFNHAHKAEPIRMHPKGVNHAI